MSGVRIERAAGGIVLRKGGDCAVEVLMIHDAYGHVAFPKGHVEAGETWEQAAVREIVEETGIEATIVAPLGRVEYPIERDGQSVRKQVRLFLLEAKEDTIAPVAQEEEVAGAFFTPWNEAVQEHSTNGYANWSWVFDKAQQVWAWYQDNMEEAFRQTSANLPLSELTERWQTALPQVRGMVESVANELAVVAPEWFTKAPSPAAEAYELPLKSNQLPNLSAAIEHTLLKPQASLLDVLKLVHEAKQHQFGGVCVNPQYIGDVAQSLAGTSTIPVVVVGFPLGSTEVESLRAETKAVIDDGALEVDMVIPVGSMSEDDIWSVYQRVAAVTEIAHRAGAKVKVILETHFLTFEQVVKASFVALQAGADFLKTSTGFAPSGAKIVDVAVMKVVAGTDAQVKAAGGIRSKADAENYLYFGAARLGTSSGVGMIG